MTFRESIGWLSAATFFILWLMCRTCGRCPDSITTTTTDTLYQDTGSVVFKDKLVPYAVSVPSQPDIDTMFLNTWNGDTLALIADYFSTRSYAADYDTNEVKVGIRFDVFRNALKDSLRVTIANVRPTTVITNTTTVNNEPKLSLWLGAGVRGKSDATFTGLARVQFRKMAFEYARGLDGVNEVQVSLPIVKFGKRN